MEEKLNEFLESDLGLLDFCKYNNLNRKNFENYLNSKDYYWKTKRSGKLVKKIKDASDEYKNSLLSHTAIAKKYGISAQPFLTHLKEHNIYDESRKGTRGKNYNERIFDSIDSEEKAYWLGFIFADGYIYSAPLTKTKGRIDYNFELCLKGEDKDHMQKFANFIGYSKELKVTKADKNGHTRCRVCLSSKHLWETLYNLGCIPNKSLTLQFPDEKIFSNKKYIIDFIRGYFDGDGWISYTNKEHTGMSMGMLGTKDFINSCCEYLEISPKLEHNHGNEKESTMRFTLSHKQGFPPLVKLYNKATIYLDRKYSRYLEYCRLPAKSGGLYQDNIGEDCDVNTEITEETKESSIS